MQYDWYSSTSKLIVTQLEVQAGSSGRDKQQKNTQFTEIVSKTQG